MMIYLSSKLNKILKLIAIIICYLLLSWTISFFTFVLLREIRRNLIDVEVTRAEFV